MHELQGDDININDSIKDLDGTTGDLVSILINDLVKRCANNISSLKCSVAPRIISVVSPRFSEAVSV